MIHDRSTFEKSYAGQAPWDIGKPQKPFIDVADRINGSILDAGCGTGDTALFFLGLGRKVTGIDFIEEAIKRARRKAAERGVQATFLVKDALTMKDWTERFDNVIDSGLFHVFSDDDRRRYVEGLATVLKPSGRVFLMCFSDEEPGTHGPRRVSKKELHDAFAQGWVIESIEPVQVEVRPDLKDMTFGEGGPKAWFAVVRRERCAAPQVPADAAVDVSSAPNPMTRTFAGVSHRCALGPARTLAGPLAQSKSAGRNARCRSVPTHA